MLKIVNENGVYVVYIDDVRRGTFESQELNSGIQECFRELALQGIHAER